MASSTPNCLGSFSCFLSTKKLVGDTEGYNMFPSAVSLENPGLGQRGLFHAKAQVAEIMPEAAAADWVMVRMLDLVKSPL